MLLQQTVTLCLILLSFRAKKSSANQVKVIEEYEDRIAQYSAELEDFAYLNIKLRDICPKNIPKHPDVQCARIGGSCYCIVQQRKSWINAQNFCQLFGMDLASFETIEEVDTFASYVGPLIRATLDLTRYRCFFTSGQRILVGNDTMYVWVGSGKLKPADQFRWRQGEPSLTHQGYPEDCLELCIEKDPSITGKPKTDWNDVSCFNFYDSFLCELNLLSG